jgi:hypothetical protein
MLPSNRPAIRTLLGRRALGLGFALLCATSLGACAEAPPNDAALNGLVALVAASDGTSLTGWSGSSGDGVPIDLPDGQTAWVATGRSDVLAATRADGSTATSARVRLGKPLAWRVVHALDPAGDPPARPGYFATWDPQGGRFAELAGDLTSGGGVQLVLIDPTVSTAFEIPIDRPVVAAPPAWLDGDRLVIVTGDPASPGSTIVDTATGDLLDGPGGSRLLATSADGARIATTAGGSAPIVIHDTAAWLSGDGASLGSIDPPDAKAIAIAFALDATGKRLAVAWAAADGTVSIAVHDGGAGWRRAARPSVGPATGAVVGWLR